MVLAKPRNILIPLAVSQHNLCGKTCCCVYSTRLFM